MIQNILENVEGNGARDPGGPDNRDGAGCKDGLKTSLSPILWIGHGGTLGELDSRDATVRRSR